MTDYAMYLDAAGHPSDQQYLCVGGFMASEEQWQRFEEEWGECLKRNGLTFPFHANEFFLKNKTSTKTNSIVQDLVGVIAENTLVAISAAVDLREYRLKNEKFNLEEIAGTPYAVTSRNVVANLEDWKRAVGFSHPVRFFVESGTLHEGDMRECLSKRDGLREPTPVPKTSPGCQAADLYAYAIFQYARKGLISPLLAEFHQKVAHVDGITGRKEFRTFLSAPRVVLHSDQYPDGVKVPIPLRRVTEGVTFNFKGSPKKQRIRRVKNK